MDEMKPTMKKLLTIILTIFMFVPLTESIAYAQNTRQPEVVARVKETITVNNKVFKDLNGNGELDDYENWDLPVEQRVANLVPRMTLEEKVALMLIPLEFLPVENNQIVFPSETLNRGTRYFIYRGFDRADVIANLNNQLQEAAESSRLGIPAVIISNPRNHLLPNPRIAEDGQFSHWPYLMGLAAMRDNKLVREFADIARREWVATGIRKMYGYSADVATDPLWARVNETFGENPDLVSELIFEVTKGFEGDVLNKDSVTMTTRHYPGGGAREKGRDPHFEEGQWNYYPTEGSLLKYHIPPFEAAIRAHTTSIMPYYARPSNRSADQGLPPFAEGEQFEEVAFALNEQFLNYLRKDLGFLGYINSDTSAVIDRAFGAQDLPIEERFAMAINAGTNIFSGAENPEPIIKAVEQGLVSEEKIDRSVTYLLTEMMKLGLFENPYVDPEEALAIANDAKSQERADLAHRKSVVMLRNDGRLLPMTDDTLGNVRLYVERFPGGENGALTNELKEQIRAADPTLSIVDNLEEATHAFVWIWPKQDLFENNPRITIGPETGVDNVDRIVEIQKTVPTITAIDYRNPWLINEVEPNAAAVFATFGTKTEALLDVIRGRYNPTGRLPITIPASAEAVANDRGDVPGFDEGPDYVYRAANGDAYVYDFGLSYEERERSKLGEFFRKIFGGDKDE